MATKLQKSRIISINFNFVRIKMINKEIQETLLNLYSGLIGGVCIQMFKLVHVYSIYQTAQI